MPSPTKYKQNRCNFIGSIIDNKTDTKNRKAKLPNAAKQLKKIFFYNCFRSNGIAKAFNNFLFTIFLQKSVLWTLTELLTKGMDAFHRRCLKTYTVHV